jgi:acetyl-CoA C-acetyltransferase
MDDIDAVIFPMAPDSMLGIRDPEKWCAQIVGARGKPLMRLNTGGSTGMASAQAGFYHIASGVFDTVLVVGAERVGECGDPQIPLNKIFDPVYERDFPLNAIGLIAMSGVRYMHKYGATEEHMAMVAVRNHLNGLRNPYSHIRKEMTVEDVLKSPYLCWPIKLYDAPPSSSGACAVIMCSEEKAKKATDTPAWIKGVSHMLVTYWIGDKMGPAAAYDFADCLHLRIACQKAYRMAGITNPLKEIDVYEPYSSFTNVDFHAIEEAGFCEPGQAPKLIEKGFFDMDGELPISPSGGLQCSHPIAVSALIRVAEAAIQVQHKAGERQIDGAQTALATGFGGTHQSTGTMVISRNK